MSDKGGYYAERHRRPMPIAQGKAEANGAWYFAGALFGILAVIVAALTGDSDNRAKKATVGCLFWCVLLAVFWLLMAGFVGVAAVASA